MSNKINKIKLKIIGICSIALCLIMVSISVPIIARASSIYDELDQLFMSTVNEIFDYEETEQTVVSAEKTLIYDIELSPLGFQYSFDYAGMTGFAPKLGVELTKNTIDSDLSTIRKIKLVFKKDIKLRELTADYIQEKLYSMTQGRSCESVYTVLKLALAKAKDRTGGISVMEQVEKVRHKRVRGRALPKNEIDLILSAAKNDDERDIIHFYTNTGCRVDEISATLVEYVNLTNENRIITGLTVQGKPVPDMTLFPNEILIHGTKTKLSLRTMPIMPPLRPILERLIKDRDGKERLFAKYTTVIIRNFHATIKEKLKENKTPVSFTLKDYRHTAATNFKDAGIPSSVYFRWFGWCDDTMAKRVYTHETDYEKTVSRMGTEV